MPLPVGHAAIGLATHSLCSSNESVFGRGKALMGILILSNLPDVDVILGIVFHGNGNVFHRGPTHSLIFAFIGGFLVSWACKLWSRLPKFSFRTCFLLILSHVLADSLFTNSPVSFFWPIAVNWNDGYSGWRHLVDSVLFGNYADAKIIVGCTFLILLHRTLMGLGMFKSNPKLKSVLKLGTGPIERNVQ